VTRSRSRQSLLSFTHSSYKILPRFYIIAVSHYL